MPGEDISEDLEAIQLVTLVEGTVSDIKEFVEENRLSQEQLEKILEAENAAKERKTAIEFLEKEIGKRQVIGQLDLAEKDLEEIEDIVQDIDSIEDLEDIELDTGELSTEELLAIVTGTVDELKNQVEKKELSHQQLEAVLKAEKQVKNRKSAREYLEGKIEDRRLAEDVKKAEKDIEQLEEDLEEYEEREPGEDEEASTSPGKEGKDEPQGQGKPNWEEDLEEEDTGEQTAETQETEEVGEEGDETGSPDGEEQEDEEPEDSGETEEEAQDGEQPEGEDSGSTEVEADESSGDEDGELDEEKTELEKKKDILEELDIELDEEQLDEVTLEELEEIREEKGERDGLIKRLSTKGFDRDKLEQMTTSDLRKISIEMKEEEDREAEKDEEKIEEEAKKDLQMLMGANKAKNEEEEGDEGQNPREKIDELKSRFNDILNKGEEEEKDEAFEQEEVIGLLEDYRELDPKEGAIKTAQIMKGFLEYQFGIEREMTYGELADNLETDGSEHLERLQRFFKNMNTAEYTGKIDIGDLGEIIDISEETVKELS
ncbi:MAG: hypothetical protein ABEI58_04155 [Candidatus Nanohaloarchaea archaeon]